MKVVAIQNYGPSGSTLLHSLLDGHPQVLTLPGLYPLGIYSDWRAFVDRAPQEMTFDGVVGFLMKWIRPLYDVDLLETDWGLRELGDNRNEHCAVRLETFRVHLLAALVVQGLPEILSGNQPLSVRAQRARRASIISLFQAYAGCLGHDLRRRDVLIYPAHSSEIQDLRELAEDFPDIFVIHTLRDPVDGLFSTVKRNCVWQERFLAFPRSNPVARRNRMWQDGFFSAPIWDAFLCAVEQLTGDRTPVLYRQEPLHSLTPFDESVAHRCRAVRLEELHEFPEATMRMVAEWIGLTWDETLLRSTFAGKSWWNSPGIRRLSGFKPGMATTEGVASFDRLRIAAATAPIRRQYGYDRSRCQPVRQLLALAGLVAPFAVEREIGYSLRYYALFVTCGPMRLVPKMRRKREALINAVVEARTNCSEDAGGRRSVVKTTLRWMRSMGGNPAQGDASAECPGWLEWYCGVAYGWVHTYWTNRVALIKGSLQLRRPQRRVELLVPSRPLA